MSSVNELYRDPYAETARRGTGPVGGAFAVVFGVAGSVALTLAFLAAAIGTTVFDPDHPLRGFAVLAAHPDARAAFAEDLAADLAKDPERRDGEPAPDADALARDLDDVLTDPRLLEALRRAAPTDGRWDPAELGRVGAEVLEDHAASRRAPGGLTDAQLRRMAGELRTAEAETLDLQGWRESLQWIQRVLWAVAAASGLLGGGFAAAAVALAGSGRRRVAVAALAVGVGGLGLWCLHPPVALPGVRWVTGATGATASLLDPVATALLASLAGAGIAVLLWSRVRAGHDVVSPDLAQ